MDEITNKMPLIGEGDETLKSLKDFVDKMENEYIDKKKLLEEAIRISGAQTGDGWDNWGVYGLIRRQPAVDVVPVVRCKDCIWSRRGVSGDLFCFYTGLVKEYYFCSYGERNDGNKKDECLGCYWSGYDRENAVIRKPCNDCSETNLRTEG